MLTAPQSLLLDLLSSNRAVTHERIKSLTEPQWAQLLQTAQQHRLEPLLHYRTQTRNLNNFVPADVATRWAETFRKSAINSLQSKRLLISVHSILAGADIPFLALKGAWLAWHVYPDPALRPLRDIDILVTADDAQRAFEVLRENGFKQRLDLSTPLEFTIENYKHMPGLICPKTGKLLEVHVRLFPEVPGVHRPMEVSDFAALHDDRIVSDATTFGIDFPSATLTLLHLIVHAVDDHLFNNGPLFIEDMRNILLSAEIDWSQFWDLAARGNWTNACELSFELVEFYHGEQKIEWRNGKREQTPNNVIEAVSALSLQGFDVKSNIQQTAKAPTVKSEGAKMLAVFHWIFLRHFTIANVLKLARTSPHIYLQYPRWVIRNLLSYNWRNETQSYEEMAVVTVKNWLSHKLG